jgi:hypothetical protein
LERKLAELVKGVTWLGNATKQAKTSDQASRAHGMRAVVMEMRRWRGWMSVLGKERRKEVEALNF